MQCIAAVLRACVSEVMIVRSLLSTIQCTNHTDVDLLNERHFCATQGTDTVCVGFFRHVKLCVPNGKGIFSLWRGFYATHVDTV